MTSSIASGRTNQKLRTRQALLRAVRELLDAGRDPSFDEVAETAMVSRATAYRYFPSVEALVAEAAIDETVPDPASVIGDHEGLLDRVLAAVEGATRGLLDNEVAMHVMARSAADRWLEGSEGDRPIRPARRLTLLDAALEPHAERLGSEVVDRLRTGLGLVCGMEAVLSARDVIGLDRDEAAAAFEWAATALVAAAEREARGLERVSRSRTARSSSKSRR